MRLTKDSTCALLIDVQERLFPHIHEKEQLVINCIKLISGLQTLRVPVLATEQYTRGLGQTIPALRTVFNDWQPSEKITFSCAESAAVLSKLKKQEKKSVLLFGIEAHICVLQTAIDLRAAGYNVAVVADCISSRRESDKNTALQRMQTEGVLLTSLESILFELCRTAEANEFKQISQLVK